MKKLIGEFLATVVIILVLGHVSYGQTGIGITTPHVSSVLDITSANKGLLIPRITLLSTKDVTTIPNPENSLMIYNTATAGVSPNDVKPSYYYFDKPTATWIILITNVSLSAELDKLGVPRSAVFQLGADMTNFLSTSTAGEKQRLTPVTELANSISDNAVTFNSTTSTITFKPGVYQMAFVYEGNHSTCTLSSYLVDFPTGPIARIRVHSTSSHNSGGTSSHGGVITYTTKLAAVTNWIIELGRGQSGNCTGLSNTLLKNSTHLSIVKFK